MPPIIAAAPPLAFRRNHRARRGTDHRAGNGAARIMADRATENAADRAADDRTRKRVLRPACRAGSKAASAKNTPAVTVPLMFALLPSPSPGADSEIESADMWTAGS